MTSRAVVFAYHNVGIRCLRTLLAHGIEVPLVVTHQDDPAETRWFGFWAVLGHQGRTSGTPYETPIVALRRKGAYLIPMPFGESTQWAKNVLAADGGRIRQSGRTVAIDRPEVIPLDVADAELPAVIRFLSRRFGIRQYMRVRRVEAAKT